MKPAVYKILDVRRGDTWGPVTVTLPDLTTLGGPASLNSPVEVVAGLRPNTDSQVFVPFEVDVTNPSLRTLTISITAANTRNLPSESVWGLEVRDGAGWVKTLMEGPVLVSPDITRE